MMKLSGTLTQKGMNKRMNSNQELKNFCRRTYSLDAVITRELNRIGDRSNKHEIEIDIRRY